MPRAHRTYDQRLADWHQARGHRRRLRCKRPTKTPHVARTLCAAIYARAAQMITSAGEELDAGEIEWEFATYIPAPEFHVCSLVYEYNQVQMETTETPATEDAMGQTAQDAGDTAEDPEQPLSATKQLPQVDVSFPAPWSSC